MGGMYFSIKRNSAGGSRRENSTNGNNRVANIISAEIAVAPKAAERLNGISSCLLPI